MALAVVTAAALLSANATFDIVATLAYTIALPTARGLVAASSLPARTLVAVTGSMLPLTMTFFAISAPIDREFGWSNGLPAPDDYPLVAVAAPSPIGIIVATVTAALAALVVTRRSHVAPVPARP
ncbi:hypothetical protein [Rhodococcus opacus]|nr:hypothetical protein [Rhodococcus opacus]